MQHKQPLGDDRLHVLEVLRSKAGEADEVEEALERIQPGMVALDISPDTLQQLVGHVKHGLGVEVPRLDEVWTNCLAAFTDVDPFAEYAAAVEHALDRKIPLVALDRQGKDLRQGHRRRLAKDLSKDPIAAEDVREVAMAFRGRLHELGFIDRVETREGQMTDALHEAIRKGSRVAAVLSYPSSEEVVVRLRTVLEEAKRAEPTG